MIKYLHVKCIIAENEINEYEYQLSYIFQYAPSNEGGVING